MNVEPTRISVTQLNMLSKCQMQYFLRYIKKIIVPPKLAMMRGGGVHKGAEHNFLQKIESHEDLPRSQIVEASVEHFKSELKGGYQLTVDEVSVGKNVAVDQAKDDVMRFSEGFADYIAPDHQPASAEEKFEIDIGDEVSVLGYIDWTDTDESLWDLKTAKNISGTNNNVQLSMYSVNYHKKHGHYPTKVGIEQLKLLVKGPKHVRHESIRTDAHTEALSTRINAAVKTIRALRNEAIEPCGADPTAAWWCSPGWCGYWEVECPLVTGKVA